MDRLTRKHADGNSEQYADFHTASYSVTLRFADGAQSCSAVPVEGRKVGLPENDFLKEIVGASRKGADGSVKDKYR